MEINKVVAIFNLFTNLTLCNSNISIKPIQNEFSVDPNKLLELSLFLRVLSVNPDFNSDDIENQNLKNAFFKCKIIFETYKNILLTASSGNGAKNYVDTPYYPLVYILNFFCENENVFEVPKKGSDCYMVEMLDKIVSDEIFKLKDFKSGKSIFKLNISNKEPENIINFFLRFESNKKNVLNEIDEGKKELESLKTSELTHNEKVVLMMMIIKLLNEMLIGALKQEEKKRKFLILLYPDSFRVENGMLNLSNLLEAIINEENKVDLKKKEEFKPKGWWIMSRGWLIIMMFFVAFIVLFMIFVVIIYFYNK